MPNFLRAGVKLKTQFRNDLEQTLQEIFLDLKMNGPFNTNNYETFLDEKSEMCLNTIYDNFCSIYNNQLRDREKHWVEIQKNLETKIDVFRTKLDKLELKYEDQRKAFDELLAENRKLGKSDLEWKKLKADLQHYQDFREKYYEKVQKIQEMEIQLKQMKANEESMKRHEKDLEQKIVQLGEIISERMEENYQQQLKSKRNTQSLLL